MKLPDTLTTGEHADSLSKAFDTMSLGTKGAVLGFLQATIVANQMAESHPDWGTSGPAINREIMRAVTAHVKDKVPEGCRSYRQYFSVNAVAMGSYASGWLAASAAKLPRSMDALRAIIPLFAHVYTSNGWAILWDELNTGGGFGFAPDTIYYDSCTLTYDQLKAKYPPHCIGTEDEIQQYIDDTTHLTSWRPPATRMPVTTAPVTPHRFMCDTVEALGALLIANQSELGNEQRDTIIGALTIS